MKNKNGINVIVNKNYELILALHVALISSYPDLKDEYDWIEVPNIEYVKKIQELIDINKYPEMIKYLDNFLDISTAVNIAICISDDYQLIDSRTDYIKIEENFGYGNLIDFVSLLKTIAIDINWDEFYNTYYKDYIELADKLTKFPEDLDISILKKYYNYEGSYNCIISILMNGGFGPSDKENNLYYVKGYRYDEKTSTYPYDMVFILECMFHEFSHPFINAFIDEHIDEFNNLDKMFEEIYDLLPKPYKNKKTFLYEYFVRSMANAFVKKYYPDYKIDDYIIESGFKYLEELGTFIYERLEVYDNFEDLFNNELLEYFESLVLIPKY